MENIKVETISQVAKDLVAQDDNLNPINLPITRNFKFDYKTIPVFSAYEVMKNFDVKHPMLRDWDMFSGFNSVSRRGFYKIVSEILVAEDVIHTTGHKYTSYRAGVIYSDTLKPEKLYHFTGNIGPLVNSYAVIFDLSPNRVNKIIQFPSTDTMVPQRLPFLKSLLHKTFYVSRQHGKDHLKV